MTDEQTKIFFLTAARVREQKRIEADMNARRAQAEREDRWCFLFRFRLLHYKYALVLQLASNYCGAAAWALRPRPGDETYCQGRDLRDGSLWRLPWVLWGILCWEFEWGQRREVARPAPQIQNREIDWQGREARAPAEDQGLGHAQWTIQEMLQEHPAAEEAEE